MKREIKRLQRLRDIFRQNVSNPAIPEQHRLVEARKRIETVSGEDDLVWILSESLFQIWILN